MYGVAAPLIRGVNSCVIHQDLAHQPRRDPVKMAAILPFYPGLLRQFDESFVDKRRRLQGVIRPFPRHKPPSLTLQLVVNIRQQLFFGFQAAVVPPLQDLSDLGRIALIHKNFVFSDYWDFDPFYSKSSFFLSLFFILLSDLLRSSRIHP
jgi:hypothetical protein